jgi:TonB family protein
MNNIARKTLGLFGVFVFSGIGLQAADTIHVRLAFFKGALAQTAPRRDEIRILSALTNPEFSTLKGKVAAPKSDLRASVVEALMEVGDVGKLEDLFVLDKTWEEGTPGISDTIIGQNIAFRIAVIIERIDTETFSIHFGVKKTKEGILTAQKEGKNALRQAFEAAQDDSKMEEIINQELLVMTENPVVVQFPSRDGLGFLFIALTRRFIELDPKDLEIRADAINVPAPRVLHHVTPAYPEDLRKQGVGGELKLHLITGKGGRVEDVVVMKPVHPYLDFAAVEAFGEWAFEPVTVSGKPERAAFEYSYLFDPSGEPLPASAASLSSDERNKLERVLAGCAGYCRKLRSESLNFVCEEVIDETHFRLDPNVRRSDLNFTWSQPVAEYADGRQIAVMGDVQVMDPNRTEKNIYVCDYQLIRKAGDIRERRIILKQNGREAPDKPKSLDEKRFSILLPMTLPLTILEPEHQPHFLFQIKGASRVLGRDAWVLGAEAGPESGEWIRKAMIWVDKRSYQVLKTEIEGMPIEGYEDVLSDSVRLNCHPDFQMTSECGVEKNGVMFPEKTTVQVRYRGVGTLRSILKLRMSFKYSKYRFFSVETDHNLIRD